MWNEPSLMARLSKIRTCFPTAATINVITCHCSVSRVGVRVHPAAALLAARGRGTSRRPGTLPTREYTIVVTNYHIQYSSREIESSNCADTHGQLLHSPYAYLSIGTREAFTYMWKAMMCVNLPQSRPG